MTRAPHITVAPNGARLQKSDHARVPISTDELAETARDCFVAGANAIHLHVRDKDGAHSLDSEIYREVITHLKQTAPDIEIQITTESADRFSVADQLHLLETLKPAAASISVREIACAPELISRVYSATTRHETKVQHILYDLSCVELLEQWLASSLVPYKMRDSIFVLGQYAPARAGKPNELATLLDAAQSLNLNVTVCAFGPNEQACLIEAAKVGCDLRVGFENNTRTPDGASWASNAQAVAFLKAALNAQGKESAA